MKFNPHLGDFDTFFEQNKFLIYHVISKYFSGVIEKRIAETEDLFQEGCIGFMHAYEMFDPGKGAFSTILHHSARGRMLVYLRDRAETMRTPRRKDLRQKIFVPGNSVKPGYDEEFFGIIPSECDFSNPVVNGFYEELTDVEKIVLFGKMEGKREREIAELAGCSQPHVGRIFRNRITPKATEYFQLEVAQ